MTSMVLPSIVKKKAGLIVNVSSASGNSPTPYLAVYAATKVYQSNVSLKLFVGLRYINHIGIFLLI